MPIDRSKRHGHGHPIQLSASCSLIPSFLFFLSHSPSLYLQYIHIKILRHQTKEATPGIGVCPQNIFQGFRGSRVWGHLLLLLTCPVFFLDFLLT